MSIIRTLDVFCDWPSCGEWVHGDVGYTPAVRDARRRAREASWAVGRRHEGRLVDYCPAHK
jgi:hypothetical protein